MKRQVRFSPADRALVPGLLPSVAEEVEGSKAEEQQKGSRTTAVGSEGSLNLSQELVLRDCCFKWKQGGLLPGS